MSSLDPERGDQRPTGKGPAQGHPSVPELCSLGRSGSSQVRNSVHPLAPKSSFLMLPSPCEERLWRTLKGCGGFHSILLIPWSLDLLGDWGEISPSVLPGTSSGRSWLCSWPHWGPLDTPWRGAGSFPPARPCTQALSQPPGLLGSKDHRVDFPEALRSLWTQGTELGAVDKHRLSRCACGAQTPPPPGGHLDFSPHCCSTLVLPVMQETWVPSLSQEDPLEKETATHSSILAWRIPWTEEPGRLQSMGSPRVRHD